MGVVLIALAALGWWLCVLKVDPYLTPEARARIGRVGGIEYLAAQSYTPEGGRAFWWMRLAALGTALLFGAGFIQLL